MIGLGTKRRRSSGHIRTPLVPLGLMTRREMFHTTINILSKTEQSCSNERVDRINY